MELDKSHHFKLNGQVVYPVWEGGHVIGYAIKARENDIISWQDLEAVTAYVRDKATGLVPFELL